MRRLNATLLLLMATALLSCNSTPDTHGEVQKEVLLFNGRDLEDWSYHLVDPDLKIEEVWSIRDGLLICRGEPLGYIHTKRSYTNFTLFVEWRWAPGKKPGNSGVLMRINGVPRGIPRSIEAQLQSGRAGDLYGFHGMKIDGDPERRVRARNDVLGKLVGVRAPATFEKPPGEWNLCEIRAQDTHLTVFVNGKKVNQAWDCDVIEGSIGLQSEGGEIHFRRIALIEGI